MKTLMLGMAWLVGATGWAANGPEIMQCTVLGCTDGEVKITHRSGEWDFEISEKFYLANPLLNHMSHFLRESRRIGAFDRVDNWSFQMGRKDCAEGRSIGEVVCAGEAQYVVVRVRENERYLQGAGGHDFTWKVITPVEGKPWKLEVRKQRGVSGFPEFSMVVSDGNYTREFQSAPLYQCRVSGEAFHKESAQSQIKSCSLDGKQGGDDLMMRFYSDMEYTQVKENGAGHLDLALTRAFSELGVIGKLDRVSGLSYGGKVKSCEVTGALERVACQDNRTQIDLHVVRTDNEGVTHQSVKQVTLDGIITEVEPEGQTSRVRWGFILGSKSSWVEPISLYHCAYGEE
ncbi:MAG: hypothetical protein HYR96_02910 [Deltaproteobacteria bacterium]|nr:hypothetical protein [Deltaproteobacteria bacterium]MBI3294050.1 hypothetical protein [Deltaproteobacteria bacterium]